MVLIMEKLGISGEKKTIRRILENKVYLGHIEYGKRIQFKL